MGRCLPTYSRTRALWCQRMLQFIVYLYIFLRNTCIIYSFETPTYIEWREPITLNWIHSLWIKKYIFLRLHVHILNLCYLFLFTLRRYATYLNENVLKRISASYAVWMFARLILLLRCRFLCMLWLYPCCCVAGGLIIKQFIIIHFFLYSREKHITNTNTELLHYYFIMKSNKIVLYLKEKCTKSSFF